VGSDPAQRDCTRPRNLTHFAGYENEQDRLMIISHKRRFVMLLPWKTASQTMLARLRPYNESPYDGFFAFNPYLNRVVHQHITCAEFAGLPESRLEYYYGSFVRNPYDRVYSGFRQLQKDIQEQSDLPFPKPWIRDLVAKQLAENLAQLRQADFRFDVWLALVREDQVYEVGRSSSFPLHPAHYWTHIAGRQVVDFVGRVEQFEVCFGEFLDRVGIGQLDPINENVVDLQGNSAQNPFGYRYADRMSARSIDKIQDLFAADFELFDYPRIRPSR
jgi:hypothetical protein